jgi:subtilisin-like proprotein convertase family protein
MNPFVSRSLRRMFARRPVPVRRPRLSAAALEDRAVPSAPPAPTGFTSTLTSFSNTTPVTIPSTGTPTVTSTLTVSGVGTYLHDLDLTTFITHTWSNDLNVTLTSPAGTIVTLTTANSPNAAIANVYNGTLWDDDADPGNPVPYTTPFASSFMVTDTAYATNVVEAKLTPEEPLGAFIGENPNGTWTVTIYDAFDADGGALNEWKLDVTTLDAPVVLGPVNTFNSTAPVAIPSSGMVFSNITVAGAPTYLQKLTLQTFITHTWTDDLDITLTSPAGTTVTLSTDNASSLDNVFNGTIWDDDADPGNVVPYPAANSKLVTDTAYTNLVVKPLVTPEEPFAAFIGENPNGTWKLTINDDTGGDAGNLASWKIDIQAPADTVPPLVTVNQAAGQPDPTNLSPIAYTVVFNEPVTGFDASDVSFAGSTVGGTLVAGVSGSGTTYTVTVTGMTGEGTVVVSLPAGAAVDAAGNPSKASTSVDNTVIYDTVGPGVTINQTAGQQDPITAAGPIVFDVVFVDPVTGFDGSDVSFAGSTVGGTLVANVTGSGANYQVTVTGMVGVGTVVASIPAGAAADSLGNVSFDSTSSDNVVVVDVVGQVEFNPAIYSISETGGTVTITVTRTAGTANAVSVNYATGGGTATAGADYEATSGTLSWANGEVGSKSFTINVLDDILVEGDETIGITLSGPTNGLVLGPTASATVDVIDLEEGLLQFTQAVFTATEDGGLVTVSVSRTDGSVGDIEVTFATGTDPIGPAAKVGLDFDANTDTLSWVDGESGTQTFEIKVLPDTLNEGREYILLTLSDPTNGSRLGMAEARISIAPSDPKGPGIFTDADGDLGTVKIVGGGTLGYYLTDPDGDGKGSLELVEISNTNPLTSVLTLTSKKALSTTDGGRVQLGGITGTGLKLLSAKTYDLVGTGIDLDGPLGTLVIGNVTGTTIEAEGVPTQKSKITAGVIDNTTIDLGTSLSTFTAVRVGAGSMEVPSVGTLTVKGNLKLGIPGDFGSDLTVTGAGVAAGKPALNSVVIAGSVAAGTEFNVTGLVNTISAGSFHADLTAGGANLISVKGILSGDVTLTGVGVPAGRPVLKTLKASGAVAGSDISVDGWVNLIQVAAFRDSRLFAGYTGPDDGTGTFDVVPATVTKFNVTSPSGGFENSHVIASTIKAVSLASIVPDNDLVDFGFAADQTIGSLKVKAPQVFAFVPTDLSEQGVQDFKVRIV